MPTRRSPFRRSTSRSTAHVAIIGGGYTGLSAALHLAEAGIDVALVEAKRVGWGASGRNGGQLHSGQRRDQDWLEAQLGRDDARHLWRLAEEAKALVKGLIARHGIACDWRAGLIEIVHKQRLVAHERAYVEKLEARLRLRAGRMARPRRRSRPRSAPTSISADGATWGPAISTRSNSPQGLARAAAGAGARIFEGSRATERRRRGADGRLRAYLRQWSATLRADIVILAGNGYLDGIDAEIEARVMPIDNYILATAPIGAGQPGGLIPGGEAVSDTRFVVYYFRPTADGRLVFGGGETYSRRPPRTRRPSSGAISRKVYPQLADARIDYAWGGDAGDHAEAPALHPARPAGRLCGGGLFRPGRRARALRRQGPRRRDPRRPDAASTASPRFPARPFPAASCSASRRSSPG